MRENPATSAPTSRDRGLADGVTTQPAVTKWRGDAPANAGADPANPATDVREDHWDGRLSFRGPGTSAGPGGPRGGPAGRSTSSASTWPEVHYPTTPTAAPSAGSCPRTVESNGGDSGGPGSAATLPSAPTPAGESVSGKREIRRSQRPLPTPSATCLAVQLQLFLNKPELGGSQLTGHRPARHRHSWDACGRPASAVAHNSRSASLVRLDRTRSTSRSIPRATGPSAPRPEGAFDLTAQTINGYSRSEHHVVQL